MLTFWLSEIGPKPENMFAKIIWAALKVTGYFCAIRHSTLVQTSSISEILIFRFL